MKSALWLQSIGGILLSGHSQVQQLASIAGVVLLRTLLQDRIASLNGRSVEHVLRQVGHPPSLHLPTHPIYHLAQPSLSQSTAQLVRTVTHTCMYSIHYVIQ